MAAPIFYYISRSFYFRGSRRNREIYTPRKFGAIQYSAAPGLDTVACQLYTQPSSCASLPCSGGPDRDGPPGDREREAPSQAEEGPPSQGPLRQALLPRLGGAGRDKVGTQRR